MPSTAAAVRVVAAVVSLAVVIAVAGCTNAGLAVTPTTKPAAVASARPSNVLGDLAPVYPAKLTAATAQTETVRVAGAIQSLIAAQDIVYVDNNAKLLAPTSTAGSSYAVLQTVNVSPALDVLTQVTAMAKILETAGWIVRKTESTTANSLEAFSSDANGQRSWFLLLGADATAGQQPVITIQLASPDLPSGK